MFFTREKQQKIRSVLFSNAVSILLDSPTTIRSISSTNEFQFNICVEYRSQSVGKIVCYIIGAFEYLAAILVKLLYLINFCILSSQFIKKKQFFNLFIAAVEQLVF